MLDVTGSKVAARSFDKLQALNAFRREFQLPPHDSVPSNAAIQIHSVKRPHVLIKSSRVVRGLSNPNPCHKARTRARTNAVCVNLQIEGSTFEYCYDDGQETLTVEWKVMESELTLDVSLIALIVAQNNLNEDKTIDADLQHRLLTMFREAHGLSLQPVSPEVCSLRRQSLCAPISCTDFLVCVDVTAGAHPWLHQEV